MISKWKRYTIQLSLLWLLQASMLQPSESSNGRGNKSLYAQWMENHCDDSYDDDDFDNNGLTNAQMKFANVFNINLHGQLR
ncbi:hypothetical protein Tco_0846655 [Tanacetum coccineum]